MKWHSIGFLSIIAVVAGCAKPTPYGPAYAGNPGYSEHAVGPDRYELQVTGNSSTKYTQLESHFQRRAIELCIGKEPEMLINYQQRTMYNPGYAGNGIIVGDSTSELPLITGVVQCR